ncbi:MAG: FHA domain-containing protein [Vicinamibacterales bacterium]
MTREPGIGPRLERPGLVWHIVDGDPATFPLAPGEKITIGRDASNTIAIESTFVSKFHAAVHWRGGECLVEDLGSSNGTLVNDLPVRVSELKAGDEIEIGDQKFVLKELAAGKRSKRTGATGGDPNANKTVRLAITAVVTLVVMGTLLTMVAPSKNAKVGRSTVARRDVPVPARPAGAPEVASGPTLSALVDATRAKAAAGGVKVADALFDEAQARYTAGRLLEAHVLYDAARKEQPPHPLAAKRFARVGQDLERAIATHQAEAELSHGQLRYVDAAVEWEQVVLLTDGADPRHRDAEAALAEARERRPRAKTSASK